MHQQLQAHAHHVPRAHSSPPQVEVCVFLAPLESMRIFLALNHAHRVLLELTRQVLRAFAHHVQLAGFNQPRVKVHAPVAASANIMPSLDRRPASIVLWASTKLAQAEVFAVTAPAENIFPPLDRALVRSVLWERIRGMHQQSAHLVLQATMQLRRV